jgi:outer membrane protein assembly factor BamB
MSDDPITRRELALDRFWDGLARGGRAPAADPDLDLDPVLAEAIRQLHALDRRAAPREDPAFGPRLWEELMEGYAHAGSIPLRPVFPGSNGHGNGGSGLARPHDQAAGRRPQRRISAAISLAATAALIAAILGLSFFFYQENNQATPPGSASPTTLPAPTTPAATDWGMIGGNAARTGATSDAGPTGEIGTLWTFQALDFFQSPVLAGDSVFAFGGSGTLYALDAATGAQRWAYATGAAATNTEYFPTTAVANGLVYVLASDGFLYAVAADTGALAWKVDLQVPGDGITAPVVDAGTLYVGSGSGTLFALDAATGELLWTARIELGSMTGAPSVANGVVYYGENVEGFVAFNAATGEPIWRSPMGGMVKRLPVADGTIYYGTGDGLLHALDAATGEKRWLYLAEEIGPLHEPAVANGLVVTAIDGTALVALDAATGDVVWTADVRPTTAPVIAAGVVYAVHGAGEVVALDLATGKEIGRGPALFGVVSPPAVAGGTLYVGSSNGTIAAYVTGPAETIKNTAAP